MKQTPRQYARALSEATDGLTDAEVAKVMPRFLALLRRSRAIKLLPRILRAFESLEQAKTGKTHIILETARAHSDDKVKGMLKEKVKDFSLEHKVEPKLQGGAVVTIGDTRIDGSVQAALKRLRHDLTNSSSFVTHS